MRSAKEFGSSSDPCLHLKKKKIELQNGKKKREGKKGRKSEIKGELL